MTTIDFKALAQRAKETGPDLTKAQSGGGDYVPPVEGATRLRFVGYIEQGIHTSVWQGNAKVKPRAHFIFELSGPKHPPREHEGKKYPQLISFDEVVGRHEKNGYMKLFAKMSVDTPGATNFVELLGNAYRGTVSHSKSKDGKKTYANLKSDSVYNINSTSYEDPDSGELRKVKVDEAITPLKVFLWDYADLAQWDALFIDGKYDDGGSKNKFQEKIKAAENIVGSPIFEALVEANREEELTPAPKGTGPAEDEQPDEDAPAKPEAPAKAAPVKNALAEDDGADPLAAMG